MSDPHDSDDPADEARQLEERVDHVRAELGASVAELASRGRRWTKPLLVGGAAVVVLAAGLVGWRVARRRSTKTRANAFRRAVRRAVEHPERVAGGTPSSIAGKLLNAAATAAVSFAARHVAERLVARGADAFGAEHQRT